MNQPLSKREKSKPQFVWDVNRRLMTTVKRASLGHKVFSVAKPL